jgi:hypothetical protein
VPNADAAAKTADASAPVACPVSDAVPAPRRSTQEAQGERRCSAASTTTARPASARAQREQSGRRGPAGPAAGGEHRHHEPLALGQGNALAAPSMPHHAIKRISESGTGCRTSEGLDSSSWAG